jgi:ABC-type Fe3+ transport system permease subunit
LGKRAILKLEGRGAVVDDQLTTVILQTVIVGVRVGLLSVVVGGGSI